MLSKSHLRFFVLLLECPSCSALYPIDEIFTKRATYNEIKVCGSRAEFADEPCQALIGVYVQSVTNPKESHVKVDYKLAVHMISPKSWIEQFLGAGKDAFLANVSMYKELSNPKWQDRIDLENEACRKCKILT